MAEGSITVEILRLHGLNDRIDHVLTGPVGSTVRATSSRLDDLEARMDRLEARER